jgi:hypothetical protein
MFSRRTLLSALLALFALLLVATSAFAEGGTDKTKPPRGQVIEPIPANVVPEVSDDYRTTFYALTVNGECNPQREICLQAKFVIDYELYSRVNGVETLVATAQRILVGSEDPVSGKAHSGEAYQQTWVQVFGEVAQQVCGVAKHRAQTFVDDKGEGWRPVGEVMRQETRMGSTGCNVAAPHPTPSH